MPYADYAFYTDIYGGSAVPAERWDGVALRADAHLDAATFCRLRRGAPVTDCVRMACCAVAEVLYGHKQSEDAQPQGVKSESTDGYRIDYDDAAARSALCNQRVAAAIDLFLPLCDPLRYRGV